MNFASIIVLIIFGVCFIAALIYTLKHPGCGGDCRSCNRCNNCSKKEKMK